MFINEVKIMQRRNLGNYEHREVTMGMSLTEDDNIADAMLILNNKIAVALGLTPKVPDTPKQQELPLEEKKEEKPKKNAAKKTKKVKEPEVIPTLEEMVSLCRETAERLKSGPKVKALIEKACSVPALKDADTSTFPALVKLLKAAK